MDYQSALDMQFELLEKRQNNLIPDTLILVEHPPTITLGRRAVEADILANKKILKETGVEICKINRGGEVTYHGPGQIVGYLIFDLKNFNRDVRTFVINIEEAIIQVLKEEFDIIGERNPLNNGVWVGPKKITAIGIGIKQWVTMHGFAFNINTNLEHFKWIVPCGMENAEMTSLEQITGKQYNIEAIKPKLIEKFKQIF